MDLNDYLAVPYVLAMESVQHPDGEWVRRAEYPELPDCAAEAYSAIEAIEKLEEERVRCIQRLLATGEPVPVPRPPLISYRQALDANRLGFARWLVRENKLSEH